ncbi:helix-turn-helix domain-containing protein [Variovorax sp. J22G21]|uniref:winged helix-turn-helix transcriptional regulator n=1 Tax=Variovorax fucosicus TaxID=3053517 RepID=UPI00257759AE|nr:MULTISPECIES: helix-turn-helix domain-containing protein [unclassified Variovorax]MDM0042748.1 helix-turn-helix domain-containing protein [Variovorax sp. J22R193]MDM0064857.1 helix-turn-helix domain-containing protein [Variovorax sp. J22G21]
MKGKRTTLETSTCAIARSLETIGDWWSLLIVRDALAGTRRFGEFQRSLGLAKNILTTRLRKLVACGVLTTAPASDGSSYREYVLTEKGERLYLVVASLWQWGEEFCFPPGQLSYDLVDRQTHEKLRPLELKSQDGRTLGPHDFVSRALERGDRDPSSTALSQGDPPRK